MLEPPERNRAPPASLGPGPVLGPGRAEVPLPCHEIAGPHRPRPGPLGGPLEPALNAFAIAFERRIVTSTTN